MGLEGRSRIFGLDLEETKVIFEVRELRRVNQEFFMDLWVVWFFSTIEGGGQRGSGQRSSARFWVHMVGAKKQAV